IPLASQATNPVARFAKDNNGVILQLPAISTNGAASVSGSMIFGIGTQTNNTQTAPVISLPVFDQANGQSAGSFTVAFGGTSFINGFLDSGSSLVFANLNVPTCPSSTPVGDLSGFDCPGSASALSLVTDPITITGQSGPALNTSISVANAQFLFQQPA